MRRSLGSILGCVKDMGCVVNVRGANVCVDDDEETSSWTGEVFSP